MKLYFGNAITIVTTVLTVGLIVYLISTVLRRESIQFWGRQTLLVFFWGLLVCCLAATRDGYVGSVQYLIDGTMQPGVIGVFSVPGIIAMVCGGLIFLSGLLSIFIHGQNVRQVLYYVMSGSIIAKILTVEITRIFH